MPPKALFRNGLMRLMTRRARRVAGASGTFDALERRLKRTPRLVSRPPPGERSDGCPPPVSAARLTPARGAIPGAHGA